ncbi:uncharacterized protein V1516DRAFT_699914 [Lipomyces oligophaga]|uniref:uncharacterized protein n=1 Tax=Lipomyces oligophaga TaxID=45792 RepID=UPI0034CF7F1C
MCSALQALATWVVDHGGLISPEVELRLERSGSTAFAKVAIPSETQLISCPLKLVIEYEKVREFWKLESPADPVIAIRLFLCCQRLRGPASFWDPYISILPDSFDTPLYFSDLELELLRGTNIYGEIGLRREAWYQEWQNAVTLLPTNENKELYTFELYLWACTVLTSRSFPSKIVLPNSPLESYPVLIPLVDSLNHFPKTAITWNNESDKFTLISGKTIAPSQEIFNNYGPKGNEELLMGYGFCIPNNEADMVTLRLAETHIDGPKQTLMAEYRQRNPRLIFHLTHVDPLPLLLIEYFRIQVANHRETSALLASRDAGLRCALSALDKLSLALGAKLAAIKYEGIGADGEMGREMEIKAKSRRKIIDMYISTQVSILRKSLCETDVETNITQLKQIGWIDLEVALSYQQFKQDIEDAFGVSSATEIREYQYEDQVLMLFVCFLKLTNNEPEWVERMSKHYRDEEDINEAEEEQYIALMEPMMDTNGEVFSSNQFTTGMVSWAAQVIDQESVNIKVGGKEIVAISDGK